MDSLLNLQEPYLEKVKIKMAFYPSLPPSHCFPLTSLKDVLNKPSMFKRLTMSCMLEYPKTRRGLAMSFKSEDFLVLSNHHFFPNSFSLLEVSQN